MEKDTLRLECLKLAASKTANQQEILAKAREYVDFVNENPPQQGMASQGARHNGNAKPS